MIPGSDCYSQCAVKEVASAKLAPRTVAKLPNHLSIRQLNLPRILHEALTVYIYNSSTDTALAKQHDSTQPRRENHGVTRLQVRLADQANSGLIPPYSTVSSLGYACQACIAPISGIPTNRQITCRSKLDLS